MSTSLDRADAEKGQVRTMVPAAEDRLDSWKEIAAYLKRTVRTVQRWERECGLPVRRLQHAHAPSVYASRIELDAWWQARSSALAEMKTLAHTSVYQAYDLFLLSRHYFNTRTIEGLTKSVEYAARALEVEPTYGVAAAATALGHVFLASYTAERPKPRMDRGRAAAYQALSIDPSLSDAHVALAFIEVGCDFDWPAARVSCDRAISLNPRNPTAWQISSLQRLATRDEGRAIEDCREALHLDPSSSILAAHTGWVLHLLGRPLEAIDLMEAARHRAPNFWRVEFNLAFAYVAAGRLAEAVDAADSACRLQPYPAVHAAMAAVHAAAGCPERAKETVQELIAQPTYVSPFWLAVACAALGEHDEAERLLWQSYCDREWYVILTRYKPLFANLRHRCGFQKLMATLAL